MHDMGKIGIPDHILKKPGPLTGRWIIMRSHPRIGYEITRAIRCPHLRMAAEVPCTTTKMGRLRLSRRRDRRGIPEASRIVAIADVFDAPERASSPQGALALDRVLATMRDGAGQHFDPLAAPVFSDHAGDLAPQGSMGCPRGRGLPDGLCQIGIAGPFVTKGGARAMARNKDDLIPERQQGSR